MTSRQFFLSVLAVFLMADSAAAGMGPIHLARDRDATQRLREERDRERREREERDRRARERAQRDRDQRDRLPPRPGPIPRPPPLPPPLPVAPDMFIDIPSYAGNGCPPQSVALVPSPDNKALSVLFDQFIYDGSVQNSALNAKCQLQIPIRIANGRFRLKILSVDLRGYVQIDQSNINGTIRARSVLEAPGVGGRMPSPWAVERQSFRGPIDESFFIRLDGNEDARIFTGCTDNFILNVTTEIALSAGRTAVRGGLIGIDSIDQDVQQGGLVYQLAWEACR